MSAEIDAVRLRLQRILSLKQPPAEKECSVCRGTGRIAARAKVATQADAARVVGVSRSQIANFVIGRTDLSFAGGLRLIEWMDHIEQKVHLNEAR